MLYQVCLTIVVLWFGTPYILHTKTDSEAIFNALALVFVLDIDTSMYRFAIDSNTSGRLFLATETSLTFEESMKVKEYIDHRPLMLAVFALAATASVYQIWCPWW